MAKGMGFKAAAGKVAAKGGYSKQAANAIVAAASRNASPAAKKANPNLKKVKAAKKAAPKKFAEAVQPVVIVAPTQRSARSQAIATARAVRKAERG